MTSPVLLLWVTLNAAVAAPAIHFIDDDYDAAQLEAKQRKLPIFVEVWAPW